MLCPPRLCASIHLPAPDQHGSWVFGRLGPGARNHVHERWGPDDPEALWQISRLARCVKDWACIAGRGLLLQSEFERLSVAANCYPTPRLIATAVLQLGILTRSCIVVPSFLRAVSQRSKLLLPHAIFQTENAMVIADGDDAAKLPDCRGLYSWQPAC